MIKRILGGATVTIAAAAAVLIPAGTADAATVAASAACYGVKKSGNYNDLGIETWSSTASGKYAAKAELFVTARCQRVNSIPITRMYVDQVVLQGTKNKKNYAKAGASHAYGKASLRAVTKHVALPCNTPVEAHAQVSYTYYDGTHVRAFWVHTPAFERKC